MNTIANTHQEDEIDLSDLFHTIMDHKWLILATSLVCLTLATVLVSRQIPEYQADVLIQVNDSRNKASGMISGIASQINIGGMRSDPAAIQTALIKSRFVLEQVNHSLGLDIQARVQQNILMRHISPEKAAIKIPVFKVPSDALKTKFSLVYDKLNHVTLLDNKNHVVLEGPIGMLLANANHTITLQVDAIKNPVGTVFVLNKLPVSQVTQRLSHQLDIKDLGANKQQVGILEVSFKDTNPKKAVTLLNTIANVTQVQDSKTKSLEAAKTLEFLYQQLPIAKKDLEAAEVKLNQYRASSGKIDSKLQTSALLNQLVDLEKNIATLQLNKIEMLQRYTHQHPAIITLQTQINGLIDRRKQLGAELRQLPESDQVAVDILREVKVKTKLYTSLMAKIQELRVMQAGTVSDVRILSYAKLPDTPLPSNGKLIYLASLLLGLMISAGIILVRKFLFPQINDPHWLEKHLQVVNLAIVPFSKEQKVTPLGASKNHLPLLSFTHPRNLAIESLRSLRTSSQIALSCASNNIISILGASPGVGKSFVACNLAYLLATAGKRVLLIDADLRRGTAHKYFDLPATGGLADVLSGSMPLADALKKTMHDNLTLLSRGDYPSDPSELLSGASYKVFMESVTKQFDIVILDTAPLLMVTDGVLVSAQAATNYLVLGAGSHQPAEIETAIKRLRHAGVHLNGSIFNFYNEASKNNAYYNRYYSYSYYYDDNESETTRKKKVLEGY